MYVCSDEGEERHINYGERRFLSDVYVYVYVYACVCMYAVIKARKGIVITRGAS